MKINPVNFNNSYPAYPAFKGNQRSICDKSGKLLYRTTTYFFRDDLDWNAFVRYLNFKYQNADKVSIINHVCSNGQEPYSLAVKLIHSLKSGAEKFLPIIAKDIDEKNILSAQNGRMGIQLGDIYRINYYTGDNLSKYFTTGKAVNPDNDLVLIPKPNIKDKVIFSQSDIFNDISTLPDENMILLCRNFWPYLEIPQRKNLAKQLSEKINSSSLLVIGDYDERADVGEILYDNGFKETAIRYVYTKHPYT